MDMLLKCVALVIYWFWVLSLRGFTKQRITGTQWEIAVVGLINDYVAVSRSAGPTRGVWDRFLQMGRALEDLGEKTCKAYGLLAAIFSVMQGSLGLDFQVVRIIFL